MQIAGAVNLRGLKEKLSKKKVEDTPVAAPIQEGESAPTKAKKTPTQPKKKEKTALPIVNKKALQEEKHDASHDVSEPKKEPRPIETQQVPTVATTEEPIIETQRPATQSFAPRPQSATSGFQHAPRPQYQGRPERSGGFRPFHRTEGTRSFERPQQRQPGQPGQSGQQGRPFRSGPTQQYRPRPPLRPGETRHAASFAPRHQSFTPSLKQEGERGRKSTERFEKKAPLSPEKGKFKETKENKSRSSEWKKSFDSRLRHGFGADEEESTWRKRRPAKSKHFEAQEVIRPSKIGIRLPILVKDLAQEMKLKASQLVSKLFLQGIIATLNDLLDDSTIVQLLGQEFQCEIEIDTSEEERIRITDKTIREEIAAENAAELKTRPPVVAFMGHVDHGKTSLIDAIRKSKRAQTEVGAITQHIGAFKTTTLHGDITILDTPGHEAFSHMRERGAEATDVVVLVVAGDEGIQQQTVEALKQAQEAKATIVVAINKCDKPAFNVENVYRQLADHSLLPEAWGGQTITVNCSALTGQGVPQLLEMIALQSEVLELRANPTRRARGTVIESQMFKGLGPVACVLVQNGTLRHGDCLVFGAYWARVKSMKDESGRDLLEAGPSTPALIHGISGIPDAGEEFIVVKSEKEAREIAEARQQGRRDTTFQTTKRKTLEKLFEKTEENIPKKRLCVMLRADVHGSLEALKNALEKIESKKVDIDIVSMNVGEISESDIQLALASHAVIIGFHTQVEAHAEPLIKEFGVQVILHNIIYHAVDEVKRLMKSLLDTIPKETERGKAEVKALFKSSHLGTIAGCQVIDGVINRNSMIRVIRDNEELWKGSIASLKRVKEDVREVAKGLECGIVLQGFQGFKEGDIVQAFDVAYLEQEI